MNYAVRSLLFLCLSFIFSFHVVDAQVNLRVRIDSGVSSTTCDDGSVFGVPLGIEPHWGVQIAGLGYTYYPQAGICYQNPPFTQYDEFFSCPGDYPASIGICIQSFEDDGATCIPSKSCLVTNCQSFATPAPGTSASYTMTVAGASSATVNFTIIATGSFVGFGANDLICDAIDLGTLSPGGTLGNAGLSNYNNFCATGTGDPNPWGGNNDQGVWFQFTTGNSVGSVVNIEANSDPLLIGDAIDLQLALYESSNNTCTGALTLVQEDYQGLGSIFGEEMDVNCLQPNTTYFLLVDGEETLLTVLNGGQEGYFGLAITDAGIVQAGDQICDAEDLGAVPSGGSVGTGGLNQSNICATNTGDPTPSAWTTNQSVWYSFQAPPSGSVNVSAESDLPFPIGVDAIDLQLAVYSSSNGLCSGILTEVNSVYSSTILDEDLDVFCLTPGASYFVIVDGSSLNPSGIFELNISEIPAPAPITSVDTRFACSPFTWIDGNIYTSSNNTATFTLTASNGCDSIVTLNLTYPEPIYAPNNTSTSIYCTDVAGWHHFYVNSDEIILSIQGDLSGADIGYPIVTIYDNGAFYQETEGPGSPIACGSGQNPGEERFEMERSWDVDFGPTGTLNGTYEVRFYHEPAERTAIEIAAANWILSNPACSYSYLYPYPLGFYWFQNVGSNYTAPDYDGVQLAGTNATASNGTNYVELSGITNFSGGSGAIILVSDPVYCGEDSCLNAVANPMVSDSSYCFNTTNATGEDLSFDPGYIECSEGDNPEFSQYFYFETNCTPGDVTLSLNNVTINGSCILGTTATDGLNMTIYLDSTLCDNNPDSLIACENFTSCDVQPVNTTFTYSNLPLNSSFIILLDGGFGALGGDVNGEIMVSIPELADDSTFASLSSCNPADTGVVITSGINRFGCDSIHTATTTLLPTAFATENITACDSVLVLGTWYSSSISFNDTIISGASNTCDSITTFNVTINNSDSTFATATSCNPSDTGVVSNTFSNQFSCDSVHTVTTTLLPTAFATENITECDSALVLGTWYASSISFNDTIIGGAANTCDSITTFNITINFSDSTFATATSCNPADTGVVSTTFSNQFSCDSVHTLTTTFLSSDSTFAFVSSCLPSDTGSMSTSLTNQFGCDSIHTVTTTLLPTAFATENITACDSVLVLGTWYSSSISFNDTIISGASNTCDSITTFNVIINNSDSTFATASSCNPADTGVVSITFSNQFSCDSVHTVTTTLLPTAFATENITECDSALVLGTWYTSSISFNDTIIGGAANTCDSITTFNITINFSDSTFATATSCNPADTGVVSTTFNNQFSCDSVHTLTTTLLPTAFAIENITGCDSVLVLGTWYSTSISFNDTIVGGAGNGCDSITTFDLTINYADSTFATATSCNPADTGVVSTTFTNVFFCDSTHTLTTTLLPTSFEVVDITECDSALVLGTWYASSITFNDTVIAGAVNGCDSITTFNVTINYPDTTFAFGLSCNPADTGTFISSAMNILGCDSFHIISTSLLSSDSTFAQASSCNPADTGIVILNLLNQNGCDSVHTITTLLDSSNASFVNSPAIDVCDGFNLTLDVAASNFVQYQWYLDSNGTTSMISEGGIYTNTQTSSLEINLLDLNLDGNVYVLEMIDNCGDASYDSIQVNVYEPNFTFTGYDDFEVCAHIDTVVFFDYVSSNATWSNGDFGQNLQPETSGTYTVTFRDDSTNCLYSDTINIDILNCIDDCKIFLPTAFSPGASLGMNDIFKIITNCTEGFSSFEFSILNRWGEEIYQTSDPFSGWDGTYQGKAVEIGTYSYYVSYIKNGSSKKEELKGTLTLIR